VELRDGRRLAFTEAGHPDGYPVLYLHGAIGTPCRRSPELDAAIGELGIRYLMVSRPGFGGSDPLPGRGLLDHAADLDQLADALGFERFSVVGVSTGAPYALACAYALGERVRVAAAVSSLSPYGRCAGVSDDPDASRTAALSFLSVARAGVGEMINDYRLCAGDWGFDPAAIAAPVHVWHGRCDQLVPAAHAAALAAAIPDSRIALDPDDGHFFFRRRIRAILGAAVGRSEVLGEDRADRERVREDLDLGGHVVPDGRRVGLA
jgi:pimeloyl-ACP methyl ester carboxylesterase